MNRHDVVHRDPDKALPILVSGAHSRPLHMNRDGRVRLYNEHAVGYDFPIYDVRFRERPPTHSRQPSRTTHYRHGHTSVRV
ncbi:hypothetical protein FRACA_1690015 [Frankia canadensis]|uniref:Uncharacterized protein n=1 Tax=Frankia canadensis TaxID=1836972 RepID=A0A2I2KMZ6_9ACTN|nr:hypothetical protein FRACA_1690015 [Frankia canadensis]SOU54328.1 hypothetical protein FRACA_1690015 [Frankia canadensis]